MAWFIPALLAGLKAAGLGAASAAGSAIGGGLLGGGGQNNGYNAGVYQQQGNELNPMISGLGAMTLPGLGMNFVGGLIKSLQNRKKYPTSADTSQRNQKIIDEGLKNG